MRYLFFLLVLILFAGVRTSLPLDEDNMDFVQNGKENIDPFESLELEAESVVVFDLSEDRIIFEKNSSLVLPLASLTKLVTASVFYEQAPAIFLEGILVIPITQKAVVQDGDDGFLVGESYNAEDLLKITLVKSSNDASYALSNWLENFASTSDSAWFVNEMNLFANRIGLPKTYFLNSTGLDIDEERLSGAYGTAEEMARLLTYLIKNNMNLVSVTSLQEIVVYSLQDKKRVFGSTAKPIMQIPELIAAKTGYTELAGGNLVFAYGTGLGRQFVVAILGSSYDGRFSDALKLYQASLQYEKI